MSALSIATAETFRPMPSPTRMDETSAIIEELLALAKVKVRMVALEVETQRDGWDDEGGVAVAATTWAEAHRLVSLIAQQLGPALPLPFVSPSGDGSVHLTWRNAKGDRGVLELGPGEAWWNVLPPPGGGEAQSEKLRSTEESLPKVFAFFG